MIADLLAKPGDAFDERDVYLDMPDGPYTHMRRGHHPRRHAGHEAHPPRRAAVPALRPGERTPASARTSSGDPAKLAPMVEALQAKRATLKEINVKADAPAQP